jgi:ribosomal protein S9
MGVLISKQTGKGLIKVNGKPLSLVQPEILRFKVYEPVLILGLDKFGMETMWSLNNGMSGSQYM